MDKLEIKSTDIDLSSYDMSAFQKMRDNFPGHSDTDLARFFIARNGDVDLAVEMFRAHLQWREETPKPTKDSCITLLRRRFLYCHGKDKEGHPLYVARLCRHDPQDRDLDEMNRQQLWWLDHILAVMPEDKTKFTILIDRVNATAANQDIEMVKAMSAMYQNNFPERTFRVIIYPSGLVFYGIWNVVQWFLDPVTRAKVCPLMYQSGIFQYIDPEWVPEDMGGTCTYEPDIENMEDAPAIIHSS